MSFVLYNQSAYNYEKATTAEIESTNTNPQEQQELNFRAWKKAQSNKPADYKAIGVPSSTVSLLEKEINDFYFPPSGLQGEAKAKLIKQINDYRLTLSLSDWELKKPLKRLCDFLENNDIVYHY